MNYFRINPDYKIDTDIFINSKTLSNVIFEDYFKYEIVNEMTFTPKLKITYDFYYETPNSDIVYLFDDEFQKSLSILISQMRDEKIDQLLGE